jgi:hypothetical protein
MKTMNQWLLFASVTLAFGLGTLNLPAQDQPQGQGPAQGQAPVRPAGRGNIDWQNMDPQQIQQQIQQLMLDRYREQLEVTDDAEWKVIEERLTKVTQARTQAAADGAGLMGMGAAFGRGGFGRGGGGGGGRGLQALFGQPSPESQALQQAIDAKAPAAELKEKLAKLQQVRKEKQANLAKAQEELRKMLSVRREAIAVLLGLLD